MKKRKLISISTLLILAVSIFFLSGCLREKKTTTNYKMELEVWGVIDDSEAFEKINKEYKKINPQIQSVNYKKISSNIEDFEKELLEAMASGKGPDIIFFHDSWLLEYKDRIAPDPSSAQHLNLFNNKFIDVAATDFIRDNKIYAMPLHSDTLALFYNKDIFNQEALIEAPETWEEVIKYTQKITEVNQDGSFSRSAIALGRSNEPGAINRSSDIINLIFMQNGVEMDTGEEIPNTDFHRNLSSSIALDFYTKFAKNSSQYTWNARMDNSIDSFRSGKTAMMLNYSYMANRLRVTDPKLNFGIAPAPQVNLENKINYANYWGLAVVKNKNLIPDNPNQKITYTNEDRIKESWKYIKYVTTGTITGAEQQEIPITPDPIESYLEATKKPTARKDLIEKQKNDPELGIFAIQGLTAKSWRKPSISLSDPIFNTMIDDVVSGKTDTKKAIDTASSRINVILKDLVK